MLEIKGLNIKIWHFLKCLINLGLLSRKKIKDYTWIVILTIICTHVITVWDDVIGQFQLVKGCPLRHPEVSQASGVRVKVSAVLLVHQHASLPCWNPALRGLITVAMNVNRDDFHCAAVILIRLQTRKREVWHWKHAPERKPKFTYERNTIRYVHPTTIRMERFNPSLQ